ncbi:sigma-54-dependent Fis family transcriptional regulator [Clostridium sp. CX1]|uniref:Sigma-54-dependent Fis family transcriptional regulator n=1 Tax=Clostridium tanneri TaxID=3037988 RepID=A0ABU4JYS6_9CLOT|nr:MULTISPECIES: sigma-54-dependent Fis family transcriptional regulator [unclassified Clostridium]MCT8976971.1 sigma-54-dependent Fis family transcriptional regulator [Clostridium sp. CX1]MDW8803054.1 sigma-54-dependent Fis family transcriptional regulator [Clostridium sp. A1-XYC3]
MLKIMNSVKQHWLDFVKDNQLNNELSLIIKDSWTRSKNYGVNYLETEIRKASKEELSFKLKENEELILIAHPIMENLYNIVSGSGFVIILTDREGCIIDMVGDQEMMKIEELNFHLGAFWTEESIGTNAIGTSIYLDKPLQVIGAEHYYVKNHCLTCSAATIHNEDGEIVGCLNMSGNYSKANSHTTGIVVSGAYSIEKQFALIKSNKLLNVIFASMSEGMILLDEDLNIRRINRMASKMLDISEEKLININIREFLKDIETIKKKLKVEKGYHSSNSSFFIKNKRIRCSLNAFPVMINDRLHGTVITFKDEDFIHKVVNTMAGFNATYKFENIITENEKMKQTIQFAKKAALTSCNVLIEGPSGTGKELFAQAIHNYSNRGGGPFVALNCASLPKELIESELFGYEKGAFTGASKDGHPGKFELANGGTIFLDEIGELPLDMQSKLLRVLDNNKITRVGGTYEKVLNVRVIAATNRNLLDEINNKNFREDLYYRLNVMSVKTIPLKERIEDIEALACYFVNKLNSENPSLFKVLENSYLDIIKSYNWPGNVRELRNIVERSYYLCEGNSITEEYLHDYIVNKKENKLEDNNNDKMLTIEELERESIEKAIKQNGGDLLRAAQVLSISRATIYRKVKKYGIKV